MTPYDKIIDLALQSIRDHNLDRLVNYIDEKNFNIVQMSSSYLNYLELCKQYGVIDIEEYDYDIIIAKNYDNYFRYIDDSLMPLKLVMEGFMMRGLANFRQCKKDLSNRDDEMRVFNMHLTDIERSIIADFTVIAWLDKEINDVTQITAMMQNKTEANRHSEANLLKEKTSYRAALKEEVNQKQTDYGYSDISLEEQLGGKYGL